MSITGFPPGWDSDYDGTTEKWFFIHRPTGHRQYNFPKAGDEKDGSSNGAQVVTATTTSESQASSKGDLSPAISRSSTISTGKDSSVTPPITPQTFARKPVLQHASHIPVFDGPRPPSVASQHSNQAAQQRVPVSRQEPQAGALPPFPVLPKPDPPANKGPLPQLTTNALAYPTYEELQAQKMQHRQSIASIASLQQPQQPQQYSQPAQNHQPQPPPQAWNQQNQQQPLQQPPPPAPTPTPSQTGFITSQMPSGFVQSDPRRSSIASVASNNSQYNNQMPQLRTSAPNVQNPSIPIQPMSPVQRSQTQPPPQQQPLQQQQQQRPMVSTVPPPQTSQFNPPQNQPFQQPQQNFAPNQNTVMQTAYQQPQNGPQVPNPGLQPIQGGMVNTAPGQYHPQTNANTYMPIQQPPQVQPNGGFQGPTQGQPQQMQQNSSFQSAQQGQPQQLKQNLEWEGGAQVQYGPGYSRPNIVTRLSESQVGKLSKKAVKQTKDYIKGNPNHVVGLAAVGGMILGAADGSGTGIAEAAAAARLAGNIQKQTQASKIKPVAGQIASAPPTSPPGSMPTRSFDPQVKPIDQPQTIINPPFYTTTQAATVTLPAPPPGMQYILQYIGYAPQPKEASPVAPQSTNQGPSKETIAAALEFRGPSPTPEQAAPQAASQPSIEQTNATASQYERSNSLPDVPLPLNIASKSRGVAGAAFAQGPPQSGQVIAQPQPADQSRSQGAQGAQGEETSKGAKHATNAELAVEAAILTAGIYAKHSGQEEKSHQPSQPSQPGSQYQQNNQQINVQNIQYNDQHGQQQPQTQPNERNMSATQPGVQDRGLHNDQHIMNQQTRGAHGHSHKSSHHHGGHHHHHHENTGSSSDDDGNGAANNYQNSGYPTDYSASGNVPSNNDDNTIVYIDNQPNSGPFDSGVDYSIISSSMSGVNGYGTPGPAYTQDPTYIDTSTTNIIIDNNVYQPQETNTTIITDSSTVPGIGLNNMQTDSFAIVDQNSNSGGFTVDSIATVDTSNYITSSNNIGGGGYSVTEVNVNTTMDQGYVNGGGFINSGTYEEVDVTTMTTTVDYSTGVTTSSYEEVDVVTTDTAVDYSGGGWDDCDGGDW